MKQLMETHIPAHNRRNTTWALKLLGDWIAERNVNTASSELCPVDLLKCDHTVINYWLCRFVGEITKKDGEPYPPCTIHLILAAWQRKLLEDKPDAQVFGQGKSVLYRSEKCM